jgi:polar amino acid transport system permease protein
MNKGGVVPQFTEKKVYYFWVCVFFLMMTGLLILLYYSATNIDYVWRWYRIPQYFITEEVTEIRAEVQGEVISITEESGKSTIVIQDEDTGDSETYSAPKDSVLVSEGDFISMGDVLGSKKEIRAGIMLLGLLVTLKVSIISIFVGIFIGLIGGLARISDNPALKWSSITYIELIRGSPLLVQIFIWYFVLGTLINAVLNNHGIPQIPPLWFGVAALSTFTGAYVAEMVRAGIQSIDKGQTEAARSLGMTYPQSMYHVIMPQALRRILPPLAGQFISLIKDSSLLGIIAIRELTKATREVVTSSLQPFELWFICALLYLILTFSLSMFAQYLERKAG